MKLKYLVIFICLTMTNACLAYIKTVEVHFVEPQNSFENLELSLFFKEDGRKFMDQFFGNGKRDYGYCTNLSLNMEKEAFIDTLPVGNGNKAICQFINVNPTTEHLKLNVYYNIQNKKCAIIGE